VLSGLTPRDVERTPLNSQRAASGTKAPETYSTSEYFRWSAMGADPSYVQAAR
jgi:hypothetical protein